MTRALVIGYGSIGTRHARILEELGCSVAVLSRREGVYPQQYQNLGEALEDFRPDYAVIANETSQHARTLGDLEARGFGGRVLVEKPVYSSTAQAVTTSNPEVFVAYNLRFHPLLQRLRDLLGGEALISAEVHVGQYLPDWRPGANYRDSYSARSDLGGGVLRDLSHELDYVGRLLGRWRRLTALGGCIGPLDINTEDVFSLLMVTEQCPIVSVALNYLNRSPRREVLINSHRGTFHLDLIANLLTFRGEDGEEALDATVERDTTYRAEHQAVLNGETEQLCTLAEAQEVLATIEAAEEAAVEGRWITR